MAEQLKGFTVALAGPRKSEEMAKLVQNMGDGVMSTCSRYCLS